jgi:hypothetical protein
MSPKLKARKMPVNRAKSHSSASRFVRRRVEPQRSDLANPSRTVLTTIVYAVGRFWRPSPRAVNQNLCISAARAPSELAALRSLCEFSLAAIRADAKQGTERSEYRQRAGRVLFAASHSSLHNGSLERRPASPCARGILDKRWHTGV